MKNICFVCYNLSVMGGSEKVATDVANALCGYYNVHVVSLSGEQPFFKLDERIKYVNFGVDLSRLRKGIVPVTKKLLAYYKNNDIDLSFVVENYAGLLCSAAPLFTKTKQVFYDHGALMSQWDRKDIRTIRRIASKMCDYTLVLTEQSMKDYIQRFHMKPERISFLHNWVDHVPEKVDYKKDSKLIISAGRFALEKQFHTYLPWVAELVKQSHADWQWHVYGDGEYFQQTKERIAKLALEDFVILKGREKNLEQKYQDYAMYVMTSNREGMPLVLLEAKANGLPVVAFDVKTGPSEIVNEGKDGFLIAYGDSGAMASAICRLIENEKLRKEMSAAAYGDVNRFSKNSILKGWTEFIETH